MATYLTRIAQRAIGYSPSEPAASPSSVQFAGSPVDPASVPSEDSVLGLAASLEPTARDLTSSTDAGLPVSPVTPFARRQEIPAPPSPPANPTPTQVHPRNRLPREPAAPPELHLAPNPIPIHPEPALPLRPDRDTQAEIHQPAGQEKPRLPEQPPVTEPPIPGEVSASDKKQELPITEGPVEAKEPEIKPFPPRRSTKPIPRPGEIPSPVIRPAERTLLSLPSTEAEPGFPPAPTRPVPASPLVTIPGGLQRPRAARPPRPAAQTRIERPERPATIESKPVPNPQPAANRRQPVLAEAQKPTSREVGLNIGQIEVTVINQPASPVRPRPRPTSQPQGSAQGEHSDTSLAQRGLAWSRFKL